MNENEAVPYSLNIAVHIEEDGPGFHAFTPGLKGLHADGNTPDEAYRNACDLIPGYLDMLRQDGRPIPEGKWVVIDRPGKPKTKFVSLECSPNRSGTRLRTLQPVS